MPLKNAQYDALMRRYEDTRMRHREELDARTQEIYSALPAMTELDARASSASMAFARRKIADPSLPMEELELALKEVAEARRDLLLSSGYPENYLEMTYDCPLCRDTGYVDGEMCECFKRARAKMLREAYGQEGILEKENFDHFSFDWYSDTIINEKTGHTAREMAEEAYRAARVFISRIGEADNNLFLYGNTGIGKTFLTHCIASEVLRAGHTALYFSAETLFRLLADATFSREGKSGYDLRTVYDCDFLAIDDLGTELTNSFVGSSLFQIINERINANRSTVISTNLMLGEFSAIYSERVFSRITSHYTIIKMIGDDIRMQKKLKGESK